MRYTFNVYDSVSGKTIMKDVPISDEKAREAIDNAEKIKSVLTTIDGKDHHDYDIPLYIPSDYGISLHMPPNEGIVITPDAVFIKPLKLVVLTEDVYNKLKEKENGNI